MKPYQIMPDLTPEEYEALKADIQVNGVQIPIEVDEEGNILDGYHREKICRELGINCPKNVRAGLSEEEKIEFAIRINLNRRHLTVEQRRELAKKLREEGWSYRKIGEALGVAKSTAIEDVRQSGQNRPPAPNPGASRAEGQEMKRINVKKKGRKPVPKEKKEAILELRKKGLTQQEIADKAKVSIVTVNKYLKTLQQEKPAEEVNQQAEPIQTEQHPPLVKVPDPKEECFKKIPVDFTKQEYEDAVYCRRFYYAMNAFLVALEQRPEEMLRAYIRFERKYTRIEAALKFTRDLNALHEIVNQHYQKIYDEEWEVTKDDDRVCGSSYIILNS